MRLRADQAAKQARPRCMKGARLPSRAQDGMSGARARDNDRMMGRFRNPGAAPSAAFAPKQAYTKGGAVHACSVTQPGGEPTAGLLNR